MIENRRDPDISIVIPTRDGFDHLVTLLPRIASVVAPLGEAEIVLVDDGSVPGDAKRLENLVARSEPVTLIRLPVCTGQIHATLVGVSAARGDIVITMDDDAGHPPEIIPRMVVVLRRHADIDLVYAAGPAPFGDRRPIVRHIGTVLNNFLFHAFLGLPHNVPVGSFRAVRRTLLQRALRTPVQYPYLSAMLLQFKPGVTAVRYRRAGQAGDANKEGGAGPALAVHEREGARRSDHAQEAPKSGGAHRADHALEAHEREGARRTDQDHPTGRSRSRYRFLSLLRVWANLVLYWGPLRGIGRFLRPARVFTPERGCP